MPAEFTEIALSIGGEAAIDNEELSQLSEGLREDLIKAVGETAIPG